MEEELQDRYLPFIKRNFLPLALSTIGLICLGYGLMTLWIPKASEKDIIFEPASQRGEAAAENQQSVKKAEIMVDVQGAVQKPGVYSLPEESRVQDALIAAGGISDEANRTFIAKSMNLAAKLTDGTKLYLPFENETGAITSAGSQAVLGTNSGQINLNSATGSQLESLPGVGKVTADRIISARPYTSVEELISKKVLGKSVYEKVKEKVSVY